MKKSNSSDEKSIPSIPEQRQIENEVVFRKANEKVLKSLSKFEKKAKAEGHDLIAPDKDMHIHFYCECSDENCRKRIVLPHDKYLELHKDKSRFIVIPGHETAAIEEVVSKKNKYNIVDKFLTPDDTASSLNSTPIQNV